MSKKDPFEGIKLGGAPMPPEPPRPTPGRVPRPRVPLTPTAELKRLIKDPEVLREAMRDPEIVQILLDAIQQLVRRVI